MHGGHDGGHAEDGLNYSLPKVEEPQAMTLSDRLRKRVVEPFFFACNAAAVVTEITFPSFEGDEDPAPNPGHPACRDHSQSDFCRESWQLHLAELARCPQTHWHRCEFGRFCAVVPVVFDGRCFATVKLVCPPDESEQRFESLIKVLDALVRDFVIAEAGFLGNVQHHGSFAEEASDAGAESVTKDPSHPLVVRAIRYIEANLSSPQLTVGQVAQSLAVNANYLSTVFRSDVGQRMGRFIALRRMEMARGLLATTDLQIKQVALDTGHANPNWFAQVFRAYVGVSPVQYRARLRRSSA